MAVQKQNVRAPRASTRALETVCFFDLAPCTGALAIPYTV